jgi:hypothetical protein
MTSVVMLNVVAPRNSATISSIMTLSIMGLVKTLSINDTQHRHSA